MWITISGPSGAGKSTLLQILMADYGARALPSYTTREPRPSDELTGFYRFISRSEFLKMRNAAEFTLEDEVAGNLYGTAASDLHHAKKSKTLWVADFTASSVLEACRRHFPPSFAAVLFVSEHTAENRMRRRGDSEESISSRNIRWAREICDSMKLAALFEHVAVLNAEASPSEVATALMKRLEPMVEYRTSGTDASGENVP